MGHAEQQSVPALRPGAQVAFVCDERDAIVSASDMCGELFGCFASSIRRQPRPLSDLVVPEDVDAVRRGLADARLGGASSFSVSLRAEGGPPVKARISASSLEVQGARLVLCLVVSSSGRGRAEERARYLTDTQKAITTILKLALEEIPLDDLLQRTLDLILSIPWLSIERKGAIFLVESDVLVMKVNRGLSESLLSSCARVTFGSCLCGLAAASREPVYASMTDERHTTRYPGMLPHGHYCVPIASDGTILGVINTYLAPGHVRSAIEVDFLTAVANTLAGVIMRRRAVEERRRAESVSRAKSEFLALVSHELLTPVTAVMLSCERLGRDRANPLAPRHTEILSRMEGALARLASRIRLLLEHARLDTAGPYIRLAPVDLAQLAAHVIEEVRPAAERKGLALGLVLDLPLPLVRTDERLLKVVLANLASNAVKFTQAGSVRVSVEYRDGAHRVAVEDTGPGIPAAKRSLIFDPFEPLEPLANKHVPGMGLGLPLARRLATALGARLELESAPASGSTFIVTLPETGGATQSVAVH
jgi:signal transduction histidine kinase